jgi:hypothetical protein
VNDASQKQFWIYQKAFQKAQKGKLYQINTAKKELKNDLWSFVALDKPVPYKQYLYQTSFKHSTIRLSMPIIAVLINAEEIYKLEALTYVVFFEPTHGFLHKLYNEEYDWHIHELEKDSNGTCDECK